MVGRKPKPTAVKKLEGNPGKEKLNAKEPVLEKWFPKEELDSVEWLPADLALIEKIKAEM